VLSSWEGNRRSGVALCGISNYVLSGLRKGNEHRAYAPVGV